MYPLKTNRDVRRLKWPRKVRSMPKKRFPAIANGDKKDGGKGRTFRDLREFKRRDGNENIFVLPNGLRENAESAILCRGPGPARKK